MALENKNEKKEYYTILLGYLNSKKNINGISLKDLDSIYCDMVYLYVDNQGEFKRRFEEFGGRTNNKTRYLVALISNDIFFYQRINNLEYLCEKGNEYLTVCLSNVEEFNQEEKEEVGNLKTLLDFSRDIIDYYKINGSYPELAESIMFLN